MKIYIKCSDAIPAYRALVMQALRDAGHEVCCDASGKADCEVCIDLSLGGLSHSMPQADPSPVAAVSKIDIRIRKLVMAIGRSVLPRRAIVDGLHLRQKSRAIFINNYLKPAVAQGLVAMTCPSHPNLPEQAYRLTAKGLDLYAELTKDSQ